MESKSKHEQACRQWLQTRPQIEQQIRSLLAGRTNSADELTRPVVVTAIGGHYERPAAWVIALNGSPVQALIVSKPQGDAILWRGASPRTLQPAQAATVNAYLASLDLPEPQTMTPYPFVMVVDGERVTGSEFHVKPWVWRET